MSLPSVTYRSELPPVVRKELDQHSGELASYLTAEHDEDGRHTHITAQSITVNGVPVTGANAPAVHAPTHSFNGTDPVTVTALAGYPGTQTTFLRGDRTFQPVPASAPAAHAATHSSGGTDPVTVTALAGYPGTTTTFLRGDHTFQPIPATTPAAHHATHEPGGSDALVGAAWTALANTFTQLNAFNAGITERSRSVPLGEWINVAFNAANYSGNGGGWTVTAGGVSEHVYTLIGKTMIVTVAASGTAGAGCSALFIALPFASAGTSIGAVLVNSASGYGMGFCGSQGTNAFVQYPNLGAFAVGTLAINMTLTVRLA